MPKNFIPQDQYFKKAKELGYRARSAFKLEEIQNRFHLLKPGLDILDLGAAPGSWLQYASKIVGPKAMLVGLDLQPIESITKNIKTFVVDIFSEEAVKLIQKHHPKLFPIILSDLAPATSGEKELDHLRSLELNRQVVELSAKFLAPRGTIVLKVFQGSDFTDFIKELKTQFSQVEVYKPKASRDRSFEVYVIARR
ncbi:MAG TPA: RlmE family RNA methyltransferase [Patescibacteria group bacterium]|nr:RlmE family RNA methyltransferase [Patescibacteria group bacterium]